MPKNKMKMKSSQEETAAAVIKRSGEDVAGWLLRALIALLLFFVLPQI